MSRNAIALRHSICLAVALALSLIGACASSNPYVVNREYLDKSYSALEKGDFKAAAQSGEALLAGRAEQASEFQLQRYYAAFLCSRAHVQAALRGPFLTEAAPSGAGGGIAIGPSVQTGGAVASPTSHWVAASYYAGFARDLYAAAAKEPLQKEAEELLPAGLKKMPIDTTQLNLDLTRLALLRRLGLEVECSAILRQSPDMLDVGKCTGTLKRAELSAELWPLVFFACFVHNPVGQLPTDFKNQAITYKFGAQALVLAAESPKALPAECRSEIIRWVEENPNFEFQCDCKKNFQATSLGCAECGKSIVDYKPVSKKP